MKGFLAAAVFVALAAAPTRPDDAQAKARTPVPAPAAASPGQAPLRSAAALQAYVEANAGKPTPLDALSPLARKRFRESLRFGATGADPYAYEQHDLMRELTAGQIRALLALFGIEPREALLDAARRQPKARDRIAAEAEPSPIAIAYDGYRRALAAAEAEVLPYDRGYSDLEFARALGRAFDTAFGTPAPPSSMTDGDLELLHQAAFLTAFAGDDPRYARLQLGLFEELAARGLATREDPGYAYASLLKARLFGDAKRFALAHPGKNVKPVPTLIGEPSARETARMVWKPASDSRSLRLAPLGLGKGVRILAIVGTRCWFSLNAMQAIRTDPQLKRAFDSRTTWLSPPPGFEDFDLVRAWNREHPTQPMVMAYAKQDWPMFRGWSTPRFHVFRNGKWVAHFMGWEGEKSRKQLLTALGKLGVPHTEPDVITR